MDTLQRSDSYHAAVQVKAKSPQTRAGNDSSLHDGEGILPTAPVLVSNLWYPWNAVRAYLFMWVTPLLVLGAKRQVQPEDLRQVPPRDRANYLTTKLKQAWLKQCNKQGGPGSLALWRAILEAFGGKFATISILLLSEGAAVILQPIYLSRIISGLVNEESSRSLYLNTTALCVVTLLRVLIIHPVFFEAWRLGMDARAAVIGVIYDKILHISQQALASVTTGAVITLLSNDAERFIEACVFGHFLFLGPLVAAVVTYLLWLEIGAATFAGMGLLLVLIPLQLMASRYFAKLRSKTASLTDERVKIMSELLSGMRVLKMYAWEEPFTEIVQKLRAKELGFVRSSNFVRAFNITFFLISTTLTTFMSLLVYELTGNAVTTEKAFTVIALFSATKLPIAFNFPMCVQSLSELAVVVSRVQHFLKQPDIGASSVSKAACDASNDKPEEAQSAYPLGSVILRDMTCSWDQVVTLSKISLSLEPGELMAIVGPVGAGKSTLLMTLLQELLPTSGSITTSGKVVYAAQDPWIMSASFRDNITFGRPYDEDRYHKVVEVCQLAHDVQMFKHGHDALIGERGVTLSGGQKARLSLARCVYSEADVYLLDDPLSAVDPHVGRKLFTECIQDFLGAKTVILVTHQLQFAKLADTLLVLNNKGELEGLGSFKELEASGHDVKHWATLGQEQHHGQNPKEQVSVRSTDAGTSSDKQDVLDLETRQEGQVSRSTYWRYFRSFGSSCLSGTIVVLFMVTQGNLLVADWFLSYWTGLDEAEREEDRNLLLYAGLVILVSILAFSRSFAFMVAAFKASQSLHDRAFDGVLGTTMRFFDAQPLGRILNRFAKDLGYVDDLLPWTLLDCASAAVHSLGVVLLVSSINVWLYVLLVPLIGAFMLIRSFYIKTAREVKRIEGVARSPVYAHASTTITGLSTIRSYPGAIDRFTREFQTRQDAHGRSYWYFVAVSRWLGIRLDLLTTVFITGTAYGAVWMRDSLSPGDIGLSLALVLQLTAGFQWCIRQSTEVENHMTSCERVLEYTSLPVEADVVGNTVANDSICPPDWPTKGRIQFQDVSLQYTEGSPKVLSELTLDISGGSRVGVCGRTGAGKSSILAALFRLALTSGKVLIDGIPTDQLSLRKLRSSLSVIPQDPVLFSTTLRKNLDPFNLREDVEVWQALEDVQLLPLVSAMPNGLQSMVTENGGNFSIGQRQLICLARAILKHSKVLVMDEATADVDTETDELIQRTIVSKFPDVTVITIAHRLNTIMNSDTILVLQDGNIAELGPPSELLAIPHGQFASMVKSAGLLEARM